MLRPWGIDKRRERIGAQIAAQVELTAKRRKAWKSGMAGPPKPAIVAFIARLGMVRAISHHASHFCSSGAFFENQTK